MDAKLNRRQAIRLSLAGAALAVVGMPALPAMAASEAVDAAVKEFTGGADVA